TPLEIPANLVRLSVGIEEAEDLIADLERGLSAAAKASGPGSIQHRSLATA
ncbi:MAG: PLP-dependent transferase, partial [Glutamicibacter ardleyensis]